MLSGHCLPRPSAVVTGRPITRSNAGCLDTRASRHSRRLHLVSCDAGGKSSEDDSAQQDVRARIAAAKQYRDRVGLHAASEGDDSGLQRQVSAAMPADPIGVRPASTGRSEPSDADEGRLHDAVASYGDAWAEKLEGQYAAAREQLTSQAATSPTAPTPATAEPSLADMVIERLSKRSPAGPDSAAAGTESAASTSTSGAGEFRSDRGSASQAAGFLAGLSARPSPAPAAPEERPGPSQCICYHDWPRHGSCEQPYRAVCSSRGLHGTEVRGAKADCRDHHHREGADNHVTAASCRTPGADAGR